MAPPKFASRSPTLILAVLVCGVAAAALAACHGDSEVHLCTAFHPDGGCTARYDCDNSGCTADETDAVRGAGSSCAVVSGPCE